MIAALVLCVLVASVAAVYALTLTFRRPLVGRSERRRCLVSLKSGESFMGVLWASDRSVLVLRDAETTDSDNSARSVDGEVFVFRADVAFIQFP